MIIEGIWFVIIGLINLILTPLYLLGDFTMSDFGVGSALDGLATLLAHLNGIFPVDSLITILGLWLEISLVLFTFTIIRFIYKKIPGIS